MRQAQGAGQRRSNRHDTAVLHQLTVPSEASGQRLDVWLETRLEGCTRSLVSRLLKQGLCSAASAQGQDLRIKAGYQLRGGEQLAIEVPEIEPHVLEPEDIPLDVLHEDDDLILINKPAGMIVHPAVGHHHGTLVNALLGRYGIAPGGDPWRPGIVHRLDQDTSGVMAVARTMVALTFLQEAFRERRVHKRYIALMHGSPKADYFTTDAWLGRHPKDFRKRAVLPPNTGDAKEAYSSFHVLHRCDGYVVAEARPKTGRTHQIRVHALSLGHPILADATYGRSPTWPLQASATQTPVLRRQGLHAWVLDIPHPRGGRLRIQAPLPVDLQPWVPAHVQPLPME